MNITSTMVTMRANHTTERGLYEVEYSTQEGQLNRIQANLYKDSTTNERQHLGYIILEGEHLHSSINGLTSYEEIFADFDWMLMEIRESLTTNNE